MNETIRSKIVDLPTLLQIAATLRERGKRIVQCHGCFDVVHPGHVRHLSDAADQGDVLLVTVTGDAHIEKGAPRPFVPEELRCENLAALSMVDYVTVSPDSWAGPILERIRPEVYVKGIEYSTNNDPRFLREKEIVEQHGGVVVYTSGEVVYSSTRLQHERLDQDHADQASLQAIMARHGVTGSSLFDRLQHLKGVRVLVLGDALIDHYVECEQVRVTAEAPVLEVSPIDEKYYVGGAGVLALHAAAVGAKVIYVGFLDPHETSRSISISQSLRDHGVEVRGITSEGRLVKTRYLVEGQKVFKVDHCRPMALSSALEKQWLAKVETALGDDPDGVIAVDFGYGTLNRPRMEAAAKLARSRGLRLFADTSSNRYASLGKFDGLDCDVVYPNEAEVRAYLNEPEVGLPVLASRLFDVNMARVIVLTLGPRGLVLFDRDRFSSDADGSKRYLSEYLPALARYPADPLGAGDALTAVASVARLAGGGAVESLLLGNIAAALAVRQLGNEPVSASAMIRFMELHPSLGHR